MAKTVRTVPPPTYIPPTVEEMRQVAQQVGVRSFAPDLVEDIVNLVAGGQFNQPSAYRQQVETWARETLPAPQRTTRGEEYWYLEDEPSVTTKNREVAITRRFRKRMRYHQAVCDFLGSLDMANLPGGTPLEQAMSLLKLLATQKGGQPGGDGETLPIFVDNANPEATAEKINEAVETAESLTDEEKEMLEPDGEQSSDESGEGGSDPTQTRKLAEDMLGDKRVMLDISRHLDKLTRMQVRRQRKFELDPEGDERRFRPIAHLGELGKLPQSEWALPKNYRLYRAVTHQSMVRERYTRLERKQLLYVIIDCSGSMGSGQRLFKAGGILMNRLKAVIDGDAELWFRWFDTGLKKEHYVETPEQARELIKLVAQGNYSGGGTAIANCVREAVKQIQELEAEGFRYRPELVVVTDGEDDTSSLKLSELAGIKLHAFVVECKNRNFAELARRTGGVGVENF